MLSLFEPGPCHRPCLILANADGEFAARAGLAFRREGWDVYHAHTGPELRRLARLLEVDLVVLDAAFLGETGWLTCAKLAQERPELCIVLTAERPDHRAHRLAEFVGAVALVDQRAGISALIQAVEGKPLASAA
jgi:DNA-binding response OmpR family regulator